MSEQEAVAHLFPVPPGSNFDPKLNIQYSALRKYGSCHNVACYLLKDEVTSAPPLCLQFKVQCESFQNVFSRTNGYLL